jgi:hypothetical protein
LVYVRLFFARSSMVSYGCVWGSVLCSLRLVSPLSVA